MVGGGMGLLAACAVPYMSKRVEEEFPEPTEMKELENNDDEKDHKTKKPESLDAAESPPPEDHPEDHPPTATDVVRLEEDTAEHKDADLTNNNTHNREVVEAVRINPSSNSSSFGGRAASYVTSELNKDPHSSLTSDNVVGGIHSNARVYDPKTEAFFRYVQVFTAMVDSFSHGANDVANAMGPFAAAYVAWNRGRVNDSADLHNAMTWILAIGGAGIVVGLATYGYKIMTAMGVKLVAVTPSRGYCIELGAAFVIIYGTAQGWPLSTTHCQVGATVAVGLFEGTAGVNKPLLLKTLFGWVITLVVVGATAAILVGPSPEPLKPLYCTA